MLEATALPTEPTPLPKYPSELKSCLINLLSSNKYGLKHVLHGGATFLKNRCLDSIAVWGEASSIQSQKVRLYP